MWLEVGGNLQLIAFGIIVETQDKVQCYNVSLGLKTICIFP